MGFTHYQHVEYSSIRTIPIHRNSTYIGTIQYVEYKDYSPRDLAAAARHQLWGKQSLRHRALYSLAEPSYAIPMAKPRPGLPTAASSPALAIVALSYI